MSPRKIEIKNQHLIINWDDQVVSEIGLTELRKNCPCAYCNSFREAHKDSLLQVFLENQIKINEVKVMGNYALKINWKDGHNTGIYEFNKLKRLAL